VHFAQAIRSLEREDPEVAHLHAQVRAHFLPPVSINTEPSSWSIIQNHGSDIWKILCCLRYVRYTASGNRLPSVLFLVPSDEKKEWFSRYGLSILRCWHDHMQTILNFVKEKGCQRIHCSFALLRWQCSCCYIAFVAVTPYHVEKEKYHIFWPGYVLFIDKWHYILNLCTSWAVKH
jgi:hypothetical protein